MRYTKTVRSSWYDHIKEGKLAFWVFSTSNSYQIGDTVTFFEDDTDTGVDHTKCIDTQIIYIMSGNGIKENCVCCGFKVVSIT